MKYFPLSLFLLLMVSTLASSQKKLPFDSLDLKEVQDFFVDDYGNFYFYKNKDFSFTKYDSLGKQLGQMMFTVPYKVQNVQNPLNIALFSENAQEVQFVDQNLNEIQKINFKNLFSFVKYAYAEDLQQIWLLDESTKRLLQYNFRNNSIINSYPYDQSFDEVLDFLVHNNLVYILKNNTLMVLDFSFNLKCAYPLVNAKRLRRENDEIFIISENNISTLDENQTIHKIFYDPTTRLIEKNSTHVFEIIDNILYENPIEKKQK